MTLPSPRINIAHEALKQAILERALQPGTKLPEDEIGAHFGMSRTLVRAVLAKLQSEGLVDARPKRTAIVAQPTLAEARDVFEVRRGLEAQAVDLVIKRWKPSFGAELEGLVREEDAARERHEEIAAVVGVAGAIRNVRREHQHAECARDCERREFAHVARCASRQHDQRDEQHDERAVAHEIER